MSAPTPGTPLVERLKQAADEERDSALEQDFWHEDLLREAADLIAKLLEALEEINDAHLPDQPASSALDEREWAVQHIRRLRGIARAAIALAKQETGA